MIQGLGGRLPPIAARSAPTTNPVAATTKVTSAAPDISALASAVRDMASAPPVDTAKVDRVKNAIAAGSYKVAPEAIAERMIATDLRA
ncbi:flagellar biosynthesis anti-sigma factor FlgM [Polymorphobacter sp. PAMC 29334]|uniref:flagellar biosynthesis anti-sigma factor FlgM n=1 Tax=Polymorphobacter sp. PAMC 29334 TaxID=2862331 RepID=UPI001C77351D|nr:flagellar biosynthesis anti-sigma factor FlgM [Polymorphobacter sp. PAMC 29334]QYE36558.1 flagellar biosynthesis anti-sigma factor FlgM [Polymorphobacter sp. PAMC 29334]